MLEKARARNIYTRLYKDDIASFLAGQEDSCDLILSGDVFVYIGDLVEIFPACVRALRKRGLLSFSIEKSTDDQPYTLRQSGRYAHNPDYINDLATASGLDCVVVEDVVVREEFGESIEGQVYVLARDADMN